MIIVSDSSPLIALSSVDRVELLEKLFGTVLIPPAVHKEVFGSLSSEKKALPDFIRVENVSKEISSRFLRMNLHAGESDAIILAIEKKSNGIILDDKQARETAHQLGLRVIGTLGVLMLAKEKEYLAEARPLIIQMMERINFRIAPGILNRALAILNEPSL